MYALMNGSQIVSTSAQPFVVHSSLTWVQLPPEAVSQADVGDTYDTSSHRVTKRSHSTVEAWAIVREQAKTLLSACDWTQVPDEKAAMSTSEASAWTAYRQSLRTVRANFSAPSDVSFPAPPATERVR